MLNACAALRIYSLLMCSDKMLIFIEVQVIHMFNFDPLEFFYGKMLIDRFIQGKGQLKVSDFAKVQFV